MSSKAEKRARLAAKAQTIEDIWESVSSAKTQDLNPPPSKIVLTPRSAEACLRHGLNPEILRIRSLESFGAPGVEPTVQRLRHETYTQRRFEMMRLVRGERRRLMQQEERAAELTASGEGLASSAKVTPQQILAAQAKANATFVEEEEKRVQKMQKRQEKELQQMIEFEVKMQEIQAERDRKQAEDQHKEEMGKRAKEKRARQVAAEQRMRELKKAAAEEAEEQRRQAMAREMFERERQHRVEQETKTQQLRREARARDEDRLRKQEEHRLQTQRILAEQQAAIKRRMEDMDLVERERQALVARKRKEERDRVAKRRSQIEGRLARNFAQAAKVEERRKEHFYAKESHHESLRQQHLDMQARERALQAHHSALQEQRRLMILNQTKRDEEQRKEDLLGRFELEEESVRRVRDARHRDHAVSNEKKNLRKQLKLENVDRIRRITEYRRLETLRQIHEADRRTEEMMRRKQELIVTRKQNALQVKIQKDHLMTVMDQARSSGARATKLLANISNHSTTTTTPQRPASANNKASSNNKEPAASSSPSRKGLHFADARSKSAQHLLGGGSAHDDHPGPPPDLPRPKFINKDQPQHLPYVSPYDMDPKERGPTTSVTF